MAQADFKSNLKDELLECSICLQPFTDLRVLPCQHSFCFKCIDHHVSITSRGGEFHCPQCRQKTTTPPGGAQDFQRKFFVNKLLEMVGKADKPKKPDDDKEVPQPKTCPKHKGEKISHFCCDCKVSVCAHCCLGMHKKHSYEELAVYIKKKKPVLQKKIEDRERELQSVSRMLTKHHNQSQADIAEARRAIKSTAQTARKLIDDQEQMLLEKLNSIDQEKEKKFQNAETTLKREQQELAFTKKSAKGSEDKFMSVMPCTEEILQKPSSASGSQLLWNFIMDKKSTHIPSQMIGDITWRAATAQPKPLTQTARKLFSFEVQSESCDDFGGLSIMDNTVVVAVGKESKIQLYNTSGEYLR